MIEIVSPGPFATVQDLGRPGLAEIGVGESGAADRRSLRLANRLVGNREGAAGVELTFGGLVARFRRATVIAFAGASCPVRVAGRAAGMFAPVHVRAGDEVRVGAPADGLRTYLAVRGGVDVPPVLGSRATDVLSGLGPPPLAPGRVLPIGGQAEGRITVDLAPQPRRPEEPVLSVVPGPRDDWFAPEALTALCSAPYEVSVDSNRVGIRLRGPVLRRRAVRELDPEAMVPGALQVPPAGQPVLFLADHPLTGGYPVIGVVAEADLHLAAQARPGGRIRFRLTRPG
ncbi:biotin-dependent carboxyltransferase family protein [Actinoallomurus sp. NPDC050550]|uniref:5-oxoprolinase subunit C family protein n=1 Tax=Actinoallomurus sp. NPDC050550 TaxID=3154937 RepID=UPI0033F34062